MSVPKKIPRKRGRVCENDRPPDSHVSKAVLAFAQSCDYHYFDIYPPLSPAQLFAHLGDEVASDVAIFGVENMHKEESIHN
mmetsp:Transcript_28744/g.59846  ORF Transcript_28744/g.59846 Transcript_28744/m.59846 type:complete len:81 (+) Transcript_28744:1660-1902(+)